jgi:ActR/RegA family two-component response regulator
LGPTIETASSATDINFRGLCAEQRRRSSMRRGTTAVQPLKGQRILVVEDDAMIALDLECTLVEAGAEIAGSANTVSRALELADTLNLTGAIVDLLLQSEPARTVAERLQQRGVPFVFYSGQADAEAAKTWPGVRLLTKPAAADAIVAAMAALAK